MHPVCGQYLRAVVTVGAPKLWTVSLLFLLGGHGGIETVGGLRLYREFHAGTGNTSFRLQLIRTEGGNPDQSELGFSKQTLPERESIGVVYFHKCNVVKPAYSIQNAWRRFVC